MRRRQKNIRWCCPLHIYRCAKACIPMRPVLTHKVHVILAKFSLLCAKSSFVSNYFHLYFRTWWTRPSVPTVGAPKTRSIWSPVESEWVSMAHRGELGEVLVAAHQTSRISPWLKQWGGDRVGEECELQEGEPSKIFTTSRNSYAINSAWSVI